MASGTSLALPSPTPTCPDSSPTTTSAEKLKRRPPFTTFATRLMKTTLSTSSPTSSYLMAMDAPLELQSRFARGIGKSAHTPVIDVAIAIEYHLLDPLLLAP